MNSWRFHLLLLWKATLLVSSKPIIDNSVKYVDGALDIFDINEALGLNLFEGDIILNEEEKDAITGDKYTWPHVIPCVLDDNLEMNAKGVILKAFEQFRLKTCINFKPWQGEENFISIYNGNGCFSQVGNRHGEQQISIGRSCDQVAIVQHELLHNLGFWHEQSRSDRDDYIEMKFERFKEDQNHSFQFYNDKNSDTLNVPYDYTSVMHYNKNAFQRGKEPTIVTKISDFENVIGQRLDFSDYDLEKLSRLYNCSSSLTFLDSCNFEMPNICGMIQNSEDNADWQRVSQVPGGPDADHSYLDKCKGCGFFMHFNSSSVNIGEKAILESRIFYPKRKFQCLEFYYYNSGDKDDQLRIYVKENITEYRKVLLKLVDDVKDPIIGSWQLRFVPLRVTNKFRVVFEGIRGSRETPGGLSIDDINLSETLCPHEIWKISNFTQHNRSREIIDSPPFYSPTGYAFQVQLDLQNEAFMNIAFFLISGHNDEQLLWPCPWHQFTITLLDQHPDIRRRMSKQWSGTTNPNEKFDDESNFYWDKPSIVGKPTTFPNGTSYIRGPRFGMKKFISQLWIQRRDFIKGDDVYFLLTIEDIRILRSTNLFSKKGTVIPIPYESSSNLCANFTCRNNGICVIHNDKEECRCAIGKDWWYIGEKCETWISISDAIVKEIVFSTVVLIILLIVIPLSVHYAKKYSKRAAT